MSDSPEQKQDASEELIGSEPPQLDFPVVGIGASAGGLEAFRQFLEALPPDTGMSFVYVQHLDPTHESRLNEIFSKATDMPVVEARDGMSPEPNQLYILPPNATMVLSGGKLSLTRRTERAGHHLPIDEFLRSLALEQKSKGIAVVLSGTSSDGTLGLIAVKHAGGITFAQDESAKYGDMPRHAIETGSVDLVLPPDGIARELARIATHPYVNGGRRDQGGLFRPESASLIADILKLLRDAKGLDFSAYRPTTVKRRIARRMALHRIDKIEDYLRFAQANPGEFDALYDDILIRVTSFFRDPAVFQALAEQVVPALLRDRSPEQPLRVWVPGCSTGEEAYSLAMCLLETVGELSVNIPIQIFATDANERAVEKARTGVFVENIIVDVSPERLQRFFQHVNEHYQISKAVRDLCVFAKHDLTRDPPFSSLDLISCRNLLIYLSPMLQRKVVPLFHFALKPSGYLVLGGSESLTGFAGLFTPIDRKRRIYVRAVTPGRPHLDVDLDALVARRAANRSGQGRGANATELQLEADRLAFLRYRHSGVVINETGEIIQFRGDTSQFLIPAPGRASLNLLHMAREEFQMPLRTVLQKVRFSGQPATTERLQLRSGAPEGAAVAIEAIPLRLPGTEAHYLVLFETDPPVPATEEHPESAGIATGGAAQQEILRLQQQLDATTEYLQSAIDELKASHEEVLSNNEELQSINEEIETGKEELQSANEELTTINEELQHRNADLAQANADLKNLLASVDMPIVVLGPELRIRLFTPAAEKVFNFIATDVGRPLTDIRSNLEFDHLAEFIEASTAGSGGKEIEVRARSGNWYLMRARPYLGAHDDIEGGVLTLIDISARKRTEEDRERLLERIGRERAQLQMIIEQMPSAVIVAEAPSGRLIMANAHVESITGHAFLPVGDAGESIQYKGFHRDERPYSPEEWPLARALRHGEIVNDEAIEYVRADGTRFTMRASAAPIRDNEGRIVAAILVFDEITERKVLQERLAQSQKQERLAQSQKMETIGRLAGGVAHDFNNLLTVISGYTQLVHDDAHLKRHLRSELDIVLRAANRAATLTSQLLAFSRRQIIQPRVLDLNPVVLAMDRMLRRLVGEQIELETKLAAGGCCVMADPGQIEQVLMNLVANARDAVGRGGRITIETANVQLERGAEHGPGPYVMLSVSDTGAGMDAETKRHIFEPFFTTKEVGKGAGLGLSSVYGIVKQHDGDMRVESEPGKGSRFDIYLPRAANPAENRAVSGDEDVLRGAETVLVAEDEPAVRTLARRTLERLGYKVLEAENGVDALRAFQEHPGVISAIVTDVVMPEMDGNELARRLLTLQPGLKVLFTSGYPNEMIADYGVLPSKTNFLAKPFTGDELGRKVREILDAK